MEVVNRLSSRALTQIHPSSPSLQFRLGLGHHFSEDLLLFD